MINITRKDLDGLFRALLQTNLVAGYSQDNHFIITTAVCLSVSEQTGNEIKKELGFISIGDYPNKTKIKKGEIGTIGNWRIFINDKITAPQINLSSEDI